MHRSFRVLLSLAALTIGSTTWAQDADPALDGHDDVECHIPPGVDEANGEYWDDFWGNIEGVDQSELREAGEYCAEVGDMAEIDCLRAKTFLLGQEEEQEDWKQYCEGEGDIAEAMCLWGFTIG